MASRGLSDPSSAFHEVLAQRRASWAPLPILYDLCDADSPVRLVYEHLETKKDSAEIARHVGLRRVPSVVVAEARAVAAYDRCCTASFDLACLDLAANFAKPALLVQLAEHIVCGLTAKRESQSLFHFVTSMNIAVPRQTEIAILVNTGRIRSAIRTATDPLTLCLLIELLFTMENKIATAPLLAVALDDVDVLPMLSARAAANQKLANYAVLIYLEARKVHVAQYLASKVCSSHPLACETDLDVEPQEAYTDAEFDEFVKSCYAANITVSKSNIVNLRKTKLSSRLEHVPLCLELQFQNVSLDSEVLEEPKNSEPVEFINDEVHSEPMCSESSSLPLMEKPKSRKRTRKSHATKLLSSKKQNQRSDTDVSSESSLEEPLIEKKQKRRKTVRNMESPRRSARLQANKSKN